MNEIKDFLDKYEANKPKKQRKPPYKKPESIKLLENELFEKKKLKHPDNPAVIKTKFSDQDTNGLTRCIISYIRLQGGAAFRVNSTGIYDPRLGRYRRSGATKGLSDISGIINGKSVSIEVKIGKDKLRQAQEKVKAEVEASGGAYIVASSFDNFLEQINNLIIKQIWTKA